MRQSDGEDLSLQMFAETIGCDPALSAALLKFTNSRSLGGGSPVPTVRECINRIGPRAARVVVLSHILVAADRDPCGASEVLRPVWERCMARAIVARRLAQHLDPRRAFDAFQAASLMDLSVVAMWSIDQEACRRIVRAMSTEQDRRAAIEHEVFGLPSIDASAEVLRVWRVPRRVWGLLRPSSEDERAPAQNGVAESPAMSALVMAADSAAGAIVSGDLRHLQGDSAPTPLGIDPGLFLSLLAAAREEWEHRRGILAPAPDPARAAAEVRLIAQQALTDLSLATQLENRVMHRRQQELLRRVTTDSLTQVKNRLAFDERLGEEVERCQRSGKPLALFLVDLDHFKQFNDRHGHQAGDMMLRTAAAALANAARRVDMVARYGGEEFVVIAPDCGPAGAIAVAERLRSAVEETASEWCGQSLKCTASIGGAVLIPGNTQRTGAELVAAADRLLYAAKAAGRNRVFIEVEQGHQPPSQGIAETRQVQPRREPVP